MKRDKIRADFLVAFGDRAGYLEMVRRLLQAGAGRLEKKAIPEEGDNTQPPAGRKACCDNEAGPQHDWHAGLHLELSPAEGVAGQDVSRQAEPGMGAPHSAQARASLSPSQTEAHESRPRLHSKKDAIDRLKTEFEAGGHRDEMLLFLDECDLHLQPILGNNWQFAGTQNQVPAAGQNRKSYCFGAIDFCGAEVTYRIADRKRSTQFVEFLEALRLRYMRKLHLVLDNYSIHFSKEVKLEYAGVKFSISGAGMDFDGQVCQPRFWALRQT